MADVEIDGHSLTIEGAISVANGNNTAVLPQSARRRMEESRKGVEQIIDSGEVVYGINTGFGAMSSVRIAGDDLEQLQSNLIKSHACGVGDLMNPEYVLLMMVFRANSLAKGVSGNTPKNRRLTARYGKQRYSPNYTTNRIVGCFW